MRSSVTVALIGSSALLLGTGLVSAADAASPATAYGATWTVDSADNAVVEYAAHATGGAVPIATISGAGTGLDEPSGVATDRSGNVFVTNAGSSSITEYAAGATGAAAPIETIAGASTGLSAPSSIAVTDGLLWVTDPATNVIEAFSVGSGGNVLPAETISGSKTLLNHPVAVATSSETGLWVANHPASGLPSIENFVGAGNVAPEIRVRGAKSGLQSPTALTAGAFFSVLVADSATNTISEFDPFFGPPGANQPPVMRIHGAATGLDQPAGIVTDAVGRLVVANAGNNTLEVFGSNASGNAKPQRSVTGVGGAAGPASVSVLAATPSAARHVRVHAHNGSARLTWYPPADTGGGVVGYEVFAFPIPTHPSSGIFATSAAAQQTKKTSILLRHLTNGVTYDFQVSAFNAIGSSFPNQFGLTATPYGPPTAPRGVTAVPGSRSLQVFWAPPTLNGGKKIKHYWVQYATCGLRVASCKATTRAVGGRQRHVRLTGLITGVRYHVRVLAQTAIGTSRPSKVTIAKVA